MGGSILLLALLVSGFSWWMATRWRYGADPFRRERARSAYVAFAWLFLALVGAIGATLATLGIANGGAVEVAWNLFWTVVGLTGGIADLFRVRTLRRLQRRFGDRIPDEIQLAGSDWPGKPKRWWVLLFEDVVVLARAGAMGIEEVRQYDYPEMRALVRDTTTLAIISARPALDLKMPEKHLRATAARLRARGADIG